MALAAGALLFWTNLPLLLGWWLSNAASRFSGFVTFTADGFSYLAKMRQGAAGQWLFTLPYTTEPQQGAPLYPFYLLGGKLAGLVGLEMPAAYQLLRLLGALAFFWAAARFVRFFLPDRRAGRLAWLLLLWGGGVSWLISVFRPEYVAFASIAPDAFVFSALFGPPHIVWALAVLLALIPPSWRLLVAPGASVNTGRALLIGLGGLALGMLRPSYYLVLLGVLGAFWLGLCWQRRHWLWREALRLALLALPGAPYALAVQWSFTHNPAMAAWAAQNPFTTPPLSNVLAGLGLFLLPAVFGVVSGRWWRDERRLLLVAWVLVLPVLLAAPLALQRRLVGGATVAMALPAASWLNRELRHWLTSSRQRELLGTLALGLYALLWVSYPMLFSLSATGYVANRPATLFINGSEWAALDWLEENAAGQVVLSSEESGARIPAYSDARPVLGHPVETLEVERKRADVAAFYDLTTDPETRRALLDEYGVDIIWLGPAERALGGIDPAALPGWQPVFSRGCVQLWARTAGSSG